jgi:ELWxxDGT repeat protein
LAVISSEAGAIVVERRRPDRDNSLPTVPGNASHATFFSTDVGRHGYELWAADGSAPGKRMIRGINPGDGSSQPRWLTRFGDKHFFSADDETYCR